MNKIIILILSLSVLTSCSARNQEPQITNIDVRTVEVKRPKPIIPPVDQLKLRDVEWIIITPDNIEEVFNKVKETGSEPALFALKAEGYENLALNINDIRSNIQQQQRIIAIYEKQFE